MHVEEIVYGPFTYVEIDGRQWLSNGVGDEPKADPEFRALSDLVEILDRLDEDTQKRVLRWATARYGVVVA